MLAEEARYAGHSYDAGQVQWVTESARANSGKGDAMAVVIASKPQAVLVAGRKQFVLTGAAALVDGPDGVNDVLCFQSVATGDLRLPDFTAREHAALLHESWPRGSMNRTIYTASSQERGVGSIDDRIHLKLNDVALPDSDPRLPAHRVWFLALIKSPPRLRRLDCTVAILKSP